MAEVETGQADRSRWLKFVEFPLVAMLIALVITVVGLTLASAVVAMYQIWMSETAVTMATSIFVVAVTFALYKLAIRHLGERKHDDLPLRPAARGLALGFGGAALLMSAIVGVAALFGVYRIIGWGESEDVVMILFQAGLFAGFVEELVFRGILFRWIEEFGGSWAALALTSILFGLVHISNDNATWIGAVGIAFEAGLLLGGVYMLTRSLWAAIGLHAGWNIVQGYIWDVPVSGHPVRGLVESRMSGPDILSGGAFGLEASIITMVLAGGAGIWLVVLAARRGQVMQPRWTRRRLAAEPAPAALA